MLGRSFPLLAVIQSPGEVNHGLSLSEETWTPYEHSRGDMASFEANSKTVVVDDGFSLVPLLDICVDLA